MHSNRSDIWKKMVGTKHQQKLISTSSKFLSGISFGISLVALAGFIIAMTRPYQGQTTVRDKVNTRNIIIAVDCSLSMLCKDGDTAKTNRLSTAKATALKLVDAFPDDHIGVMAFAGSANMISSITIDHPSVKQALDQIDIYSAHTRGSNFTNSVINSIEALKNAGKSANALILITDGTEDKPDITDLVKRAKDAQVQIFTIGVGSPAGGTIPIQLPDSRVTQHLDQYGRAVITKLDDAALRQLAIGTEGSYSNASNANEMIVDAVNKMKQFEKQGRVREVPHEMYQWFLAPSIILLIISVMLKAHWRKPMAQKTAILTALAFPFILPAQSEAQESDSFAKQTKMTLFQKPAFIREGYRALESKNYSEAIMYLNAARIHSDGEQHAELSHALAQAYYRNREFKSATEAYGDAIISSDEKVQIDAQYNMGNALFRTAVADFDPPKDEPFAQYLENAIRGDKGVEKLSGIDSIKKTLQNSITKYSETLIVDNAHSQALKNKRTAEELLKSIEDIQEKIRKEEEKKKQEEDKKNKDKKQDPKDDKKEGDKKKDKDKDKDKKDEVEKEDKGDEPEDGEKGSEEGDKGEKDSKNKNTKEGDTEGEPKEKKESGKEGQPKETGEKKDSKQGDPEKMSESDDGNAQEKGEFETEEEARKFMKQMSDQRKKPNSRQRGWRNSSNDW